MVYEIALFKPIYVLIIDIYLYYSGVSQDGLLTGASLVGPNSNVTVYKDCKIFVGPRQNIKNIQTHISAKFSGEESRTMFKEIADSDHVFYHTWDSLVNDISIDAILDASLSAKLIVHYQYIEIKKPVHNEYDQAALLLGYIRKKGNAGLVDFLKVLCDRDQDHIVGIIVKGLKELKSDEVIKFISDNAVKNHYDKLVIVLKELGLL